MPPNSSLHGWLCRLHGNPPKQPAVQVHEAFCTRSKSDGGLVSEAPWINSLAGLHVPTLRRLLHVWRLCSLFGDFCADVNHCQVKDRCTGRGKWFKFTLIPIELFKMSRLASSISRVLSSLEALGTSLQVQSSPALCVSSVPFAKPANLSPATRGAFYTTAPKLKCSSFSIRVETIAMPASARER